MHPRIKELLDDLDARRGELRQTVDSIPSEQLDTQPAKGGWSVANVLEHLSLVESRIAGLLQKRIEEARAAGLGPETETSSILEQPGLEQVTNRTKTLVSPEPLRPTSTLDAAAAWKSLEATRERLRAVLISADGLAIGQISHPHTYFGPLSAYQWFAFVAGHEARHTAQIREIAASLSA